MATEETSSTLNGVEENVHIVKFVVLLIHSIEINNYKDLPQQQQEWYYQVQVLTLTRTRK